MARSPRLSHAEIDQAPDALIVRAESATRALDATRMAAARVAAYAPALVAAGRMQALDFVRAVSTTAIAQAFAEVRRSADSYVGLPYPDPETGEIRQVESLEEYCRVFLGRSYSTCVEAADRLHLLGPELYERAQAIGLRTKDYRDLRALPEDERAAVLAAIETGERDEVLDTLTGLIARHREGRETAERAAESASRERDETRANYEAASSIIGEQAAEIRRLKGGDVPPPALDARMAAWIPAATYLLGELRKNVAQLAQLVGAAGDLADPDPRDADAVRAHASVMRALDDALSPGLAQHIEEAQSLQMAVERRITDRVYAPESSGAAADGSER